MGVQNKALAIIFITILLGQLSNAHRRESEEQADCAISYAAGAVGGAGLLAAVGYGIAFVGFGPAGIVAGSLASTIMSTAATYGVGGGIVAAVQSAGVVGLGAVTKAAIVGTGAVVGYTAAGGCGSKGSDEKKGGR